MKESDQRKTEVVNLLKEILQESYPLCDDGNPNENIFVSINKKAYQCLRLIES